MVALSHNLYVSRLPQVPSLLGHSRNRSERNRYGTEDGYGQWLGMVSDRPDLSTFTWVSNSLLGGQLASGNFSGLGLLPPSFSGSLATSTIPTAGAFRRLAAPLQSMFHAI